MLYPFESDADDVLHDTYTPVSDPSTSAAAVTRSITPGFSLSIPNPSVLSAGPVSVPSLGVTLSLTLAIFVSTRSVLEFHVTVNVSPADGAYRLLVDPVIVAGNHAVPLSFAYRIDTVQYWLSGSTRKNRTVTLPA